MTKAAASLFVNLSTGWTFWLDGENNPPVLFQQVGSCRVHSFSLAVHKEGAAEYIPALAGQHCLIDCEIVRARALSVAS